MKKLCGLLLTALIMLYACQKEVSYENGNGLSAEGSLQSEVTGDCLPKEVAGTFEAGVELVSAANAIEVTVNVTKTGPYLIYTDTVNGYYFRATGNFTATGFTTVTLPGKGKPEIDGIDNFRVIFDTSTCILPVTVLPAGGGIPAEFTFAGSPNACMDFSVNGNYVIDVALTAANTVDIKVNVTTAGTYALTTVASNGISFTGTGTVLTGEQIITLKGSGTPLSEGTTTLPVTHNGSGCSFTVEVLATAPVDRNYFPHTGTSNWSYDRDNNPNDSLIYRSKTPQVTFLGNNYNMFEAKDALLTDFVNVAAYRKASGSYYVYTDLSYWLSFEDPQEVEFLFLKDNAAVGNTWTTATYSGTRGGDPIKVRIKFAVVQKDISLSVTSSTGTKTYNNVLVVEEHYEIEQPDGSFQEDVIFYKHHYADGVGLVLDEIHETDNPINIIYRETLRRYQVVP